MTGLRGDGQDSETACLRFHKRSLSNSEFGKRRTLGLESQFKTICNDFDGPDILGDKVGKWWRRPLSKASHVCVWGKNYFLDKLTITKNVTLQNKSRNLFSCFLLWGWVSVYMEKKRQLHLEKYERVRDRRLWEGAVSNAHTGWTSWKIQIRRYLDLGHEYLYLIYI